MLSSYFRFCCLGAFAGLVLLAATQDVSGQFIDRLRDEADQERVLKLKLPVQMILQTDRGIVLRGDLLEVRDDSLLVLPTKSRDRNPEGVEILYEKMTVINLPTLELKFRPSEDDLNDFYTDLAESEGVEIANADEFVPLHQKILDERARKVANSDLAAQDSTTGEENPSPEMSTTTGARTDQGDDSQVRVMQPADEPDPVPELGEVIEIVICGSCNKEVSVTAQTGQKCPHCGVLWDNSPDPIFNFVDDTSVQTHGDISGNEMTSQRSTQLLAQNNTGDANRIGARPGAQPPAAGPNQAVIPPPPIENQTTVEDINLENLPVWMKAAIFLGSLAIMYYVFFYRS